MSKDEYDRLQADLDDAILKRARAADQSSAVRRMAEAELIRCRKALEKHMLENLI